MGVLLSAALLCVFALAFVKLGSVPMDAAPIISLFTGALGAFAAGWLTVKLCGSRGMLMGALSGLLIFLAVLLGSLISGSAGAPASLLVKLAVFVVSGAVGGIMRVNKRVKTPKIK